MKQAIITELLKHGWQLAPEDVSHVVLARMPVKTFVGEQFAVIRPVVRFECGTYSIHAEFISRGENALALCYAYIAEVGEVVEGISKFHEDVMKRLSEAFSVRMAK